MSEKKLKQLRKLTGFKTKGQEPKFKRIKVKDIVTKYLDSKGDTKEHSVGRYVLTNVNKIQYTLDKRNYKQKVK